jgi:hypothetical protein
VESVSVDRDAPVAGVVITTGTDVEEAFVTVFCTCNCTVEGVATMLLASGIDRVLESTTAREIRSRDLDGQVL